MAKAPVFGRGILGLCVQYSGWSITYTPREFAGLARVLIWGLDMVFGRDRRRLGVSGLKGPVGLG
jgi:hypothetical protein